MSDKTGVISDLGITGKINICKQNANGDITWEEDVHNDIVDATRNKLASALQNKDYNWSSVASTLIAFNSSTYLFSNSKACADLGGSATNWSPDATCIMAETETSNDLVMMWDSVSTAGATVSGNDITVSALLTGHSTATYDTARLGIINTFFGTGSGSVSWRNEWAVGTFTAVTVTSADTLTVTWTLSVG